MQSFNEINSIKFLIRLNSPQKSNKTKNSKLNENNDQRKIRAESTFMLNRFALANQRMLGDGAGSKEDELLACVVLRKAEVADVSGVGESTESDN